MTKPIIVVKIPGYKLLYIIQVRGSSWPYLISKVLVTYQRFWSHIRNHSYNAGVTLFYSQAVIMLFSGHILEAIVFLVNPYY